MSDLALVVGGHVQRLASSRHREGAGGDVDVVQAQAGDVGARQRVHRRQ
jgi:hypothetical protein